MSELELVELDLRFRAARKAAGSRSYERRAPHPESTSQIDEIRSDVGGYVVRNPRDPEGWRLLSKVCELAMDYRCAARFLRRAGALSPGTVAKKDQSKLAKMDVQAQFWKNIGLKPHELQLLGDYLSCALEESGGERSLRLTDQWLCANMPERRDLVLSSLRMAGGHTDALVLLNVV